MKIRLRSSTFLIYLALWGSSYIEWTEHPLRNHVEYLCVTFNKRITWRLRTELIEARAFRIFNRVCSISKSGRLSANIKLILHDALIRSIMTYSCSAWEFAADTHFLKLQRLQNKVLLTTGNSPRCTSVRDLHRTFDFPYVYDYITKLCRQ
jgi:hypothetical protein